jgi:hypothetical protein
VKLAPPMCFNSKQIGAEVQRLGKDVIGASIKRGTDRLEAFGKPDLFAGVIVGWETAIGRDYNNGKLPLGDCALTNRGFSKATPPKDRNSEMESVVHDFIQLWAKSMVDAGIPRDKLFAHVAYPDPAAVAQAQKDRKIPADLTYSELVGYAPAKVTFNNPYLSPGFTAYLSSSEFTNLYDQLRSEGITRWASSEGTSKTMESYLGSIFNHGGVLANLMGWGLGPDSPDNQFRYATEGPSALAAYKKFLYGGQLVETPTAGSGGAR